MLEWFGVVVFALVMFFANGVFTYGIDLGATHSYLMKANGGSSSVETDSFAKSSEGSLSAKFNLQNLSFWMTTKKDDPNWRQDSYLKRTLMIFELRGTGVIITDYYALGVPGSRITASRYLTREEVDSTFFHSAQKSSGRAVWRRVKKTRLSPAWINYQVEKALRENPSWLDVKTD